MKNLYFTQANSLSGTLSPLLTFLLYLLCVDFYAAVVKKLNGQSGVSKQPISHQTFSYEVWLQTGDGQLQKVPYFNGLVIRVST